MELISVLVPTYNRAHMIGKAIKSLLEQTHSNLQIIIVDDGSTDNTSEVVKGFGDKRIDYYKINHVGISKALNYGLSKAESILLLDLIAMIIVILKELIFNIHFIMKIEAIWCNRF